MPRPGGRPNEKAADFKGSLKRLFKNMKRWRTFMIIAIILAATSSIFSLVSPNKLSDITDAITEGITPDIETFKEITTNITNSLQDSENMTKKTESIMMNPSISNEDKQSFQSILSTLKDADEKTKTSLLMSLPDSILKELLTEFSIDGVTISTTDQLSTLKILMSTDMEDTTAALKTFDELPKPIYELVKPKMDIDYIQDIALFLLILYIIGAILGYIENFMLSTVSNRFAQNLRGRISKKINRLPLKYFDNHEMGDILSRITNDVDAIAQNLNDSLSTLVSGVTLFLGSLIMMFTTNWIMALTAIAASLIGFALMFTILRKSQKYFNQKQTELGKLNGHIEEIYSGHNVVKAYNGENHAKEEFRKLNQNLYNCNQKSMFLSGLMPSLMNFIGNFGYVAVCIVGALLTMNGHITFGVIVAFMLYVRLFTSPLSQIAQAMTRLQSTAAASERVFEFLDEQEMSDQKEITKRLDGSKVKGEIEFKDVKFGYNDDRIIIKDFSVKAKPGEKIAIVGPTGAGKTTMVNLLMKFYDIKDGDILIDGISTKELSRENIHKLFTMVLQDTWLFEGSVRENIKFNRENISDEEIWEALKVVGVDHFIKTLPGGLDAMLDDGDAVSSGQKQLLTIARGMIEDAPFLILDEATSNVDTRTEELVQKAMDNLTTGRTSFIIAHRLSTIKNADTILVMKDGDIVEQGNHQDLMKKNGFYAELYNAQFTNN